MKITQSHQQGLIRIHPRPQTTYCIQGRAVLATDLDGFIHGKPQHGLFVGETRMLSVYRFLVAGESPQRVAVSNVEQHSWLGYFIVPPPDIRKKTESVSGVPESASEETIELKVSRTVGLGVHEDIDFTSFVQRPISLTLEIELDADFADQAETSRRKQHGQLRKRWRTSFRGERELHFTYRARQQYSHQGNRGTAALERGLIVRLEKCDSLPSYRSGRLRFAVSLRPKQGCHACLKFIPIFDGAELAPLYKCRRFFGTHNARIGSGASSFRSPLNLKPLRNAPWPLP
jgi:hypothetical protein